MFLAKFIALISYFYCFVLCQYEISDDLGLGRRFDGIGALSGGGATSKLLVNYPEPHRSRILDYLFKPKFGASLQILKVEIGGDGQSGAGTEASHMHNEWEENYQRGYEWWLMIEAKKRNPNIKLFGLPWTWPYWLGDKAEHPYKTLKKTATYIVKWILGAKQHYNLSIDYIGVWNEQRCDFDYILKLRQILDENQLQHIQIIACDEYTDDFIKMNRNKTVMDTLGAYGVHYPSTESPQQAILSNRTLWSSEDYSTFNDEVGGGCWARTLNQNYVNGYMTSTIAWNLIASYYYGMNYQGDGLMTAIQPWSGYYEVQSPIWMSAHTTQFTEIGWNYLLHGHGVGVLRNGGSYVSFVSKDSKDLTIVIETLTPNHSICLHAKRPTYNVTKQKATFKFGGSLSKLKSLFLWQTNFKFERQNALFQIRSQSTLFQYIGIKKIENGRLVLSLEPDSVYTLSTVSEAQHGTFDNIPNSQPFPLPYKEDFQNYRQFEEPYNLSPQIGSWEILQDSSNNQLFARQTVLALPVIWVTAASSPIAYIGNANWTNINITCKMRVPSVNGTDSVFVGVQVKTPGYSFGKTTGLFFWIDTKLSAYTITRDIAATLILDIGLLKSKMKKGTWFVLSLNIKDTLLTASLNGEVLTSIQVSKKILTKGFAAIGSASFGYSDIGHLRLNPAT